MNLFFLQINTKQLLVNQDIFLPLSPFFKACKRQVGPNACNATVSFETVGPDADEFENYRAR